MLLWWIFSQGPGNCSQNGNPTFYFQVLRTLGDFNLLKPKPHTQALCPENAKDMLASSHSFRNRKLALLNPEPLNPKPAFFAGPAAQLPRHRCHLQLLLASKCFSFSFCFFRARFSIARLKRFQGSGMRVYGGLAVYGSGFQVWGFMVVSRFRVWGSGLRVWGLGA